MLGDMVMLPVRLSARVASLTLRGTEGAVQCAVSIAGRLLGAAATSSQAPSAPSSRRPAAEGPATAAPPRRPAADPRRAPAGPAAPAPPHPPAPTVSTPTPQTPDPYAETPPEPVHVSEEASLVEAFAEPGAEDGAGAQVTIAEPWTGYRKLTAQDVIERVGASDSAALAAISLYESLHQNRPTVLKAVERKLAELTAGTRSPE